MASSKPLVRQHEANGLRHLGNTNRSRKEHAQIVDIRLEFRQRDKQDPDSRTRFPGPSGQSHAVGLARLELNSGQQYFELAREPKRVPGQHRIR